MRLLLIRHGDPDYSHDCLTPLGHVQAEAAAHRLQNEKIAAIYSSTMGRAMETAEHTGKILDLPVNGVDFAREINGSPRDQAEFDAYCRLPWEERRALWKEEYSPWSQGHKTIQAGLPLNESTPRFARNACVDHFARVASGLDAWLADLGYVREGLYYRVSCQNDDTVALFGHGGSFGGVLGHLLNVAPEAAIMTFGFSLTGISEIRFSGAVGELIQPNLSMLNDAKHIENCEITYGV